LIEAKISRVVVAIGSDPDENVSGTGIAILKKAGILVDTGICEMEARESLRAYLHQRRTGQAYVVVKVGMSMNGKISFEDGTSQWITSESSREEAMKIRAQSQAILVGVNTVLVDNPKLTLRGLHANTDRGIIPFTRVVIDPTGKLAKPENSALNIVNDTGGPVLVFTTNPTLTIHHQIEWIYMQNIDVRKILTELAKRGIIQVLVEGGSTTLSHFFNEDLVNELVLFVAPTMIGSGGLSFYSSPFPNTIADRKKWRLAHVAPVRDGNGDIRIDYRFAY
jgi:diaminohydroxyphosphoribosylaminopyrimidine deaminase/5-amino-6-(5-phosphoribosylamino)uracil reductase